MCGSFFRDFGRLKCVADLSVFYLIFSETHFCMKNSSKLLLGTFFHTNNSKKFPPAAGKKVADLSVCFLLLKIAFWPTSVCDYCTGVFNIKTPPKSPEHLVKVLLFPKSENFSRASRAWLYF